MKIIGSNKHHIGKYVYVKYGWTKRINCEIIDVRTKKRKGVKYIQYRIYIPAHAYGSKYNRKIWLDECYIYEDTFQDQVKQWVESISDKWNKLKRKLPRIW